MKKKAEQKIKLPGEQNYLKGYRPLLFIALAAFLIYLPTLWFNFSPLDERFVIFNQQKLLSDFGNFPDLFQHSILDMYYRPLCMASFMVDMIIGKGTPFIFHFTNILLHVLCSLLLFRLLLQVKINREFAFIAALFFAVHPINVHSVAWIPGRNDSLLCLFTLISCIQLLRYFETGKMLHLIMHFFVFTMALFTKENAIVLPALYFLLWIVFRTEKNIRVIIFPALAWFIVGVSWFIIRKNVVDYLPPSSSTSLTDSLVNFFKAITIYTGRIILPVQQSVFPVLRDIAVLPFLIATIVLVAITLKFGLRDKKIALLGIAWFFIFLLIPMWIGSTNTNGDQYEHRIYTSLTGAFLFFSQLDIAIKPAIARKFAVLLLIVFSVKTVVRSSVYKDQFSFALAGTAESPSVHIFHDMVGFLYAEQKEYTKALPYFNEAIRLYPKPDYYHHRGNAYYDTKDFKHALEDFNRALESKEHLAQTLVSRSMTYLNLGKHTESLRDLEAAEKAGATDVPRAFTRDLFIAFQRDTITMYTKAIMKDSLDARAYNGRGIALMHINQFQAAITDFDRALAILPSDPSINYNKELALKKLNEANGKNK
jgi:hypothetical protein